MDVKLVNLTKEFQSKGKKGEGPKTVLAVDHIDCDIHSGKLIGLLGPSGCGKSTTLYMIAGLHKPTEGQVIFGDKDVTDLSPEKRGIGLVFQNYALYPHLTVAENIMFPLLSRKENKKIAYKKALEMAELVGIADYMDRKPSELSGGQQQRVAIARAIVKVPDVLLLDEPLSNLDARLRIQTREEIKRIQRTTGITTIFVTHDQEEAMSISDEIIVMNNGSIQQIGKPQDVYNEPNNEFTAKFLGTPAINIIEAKYDDEKLTFGDQEFKDDITPRGARMILTPDTHIGIRPEFVEIDSEGKYDMHIETIEYIGRDKVVVFTLPGIKEKYKCIIPQEVNCVPNSDAKFNLKRYFLFDIIGRRLK